jgi:hypothetical protein
VKVTDVELFTGKPDFEFEPIRQIEAKCESSHAFSNAPSMEEVNSRLRALAAKVGANAVINVDYESGISLTSWRALKGTGLAVRKISDERQCPFCAETIKRAAVKCRFCGEDVSHTAALAEVGSSIREASSQPVAVSRVTHINQEPLRSSDAMPAWVWLLIGGVVLVIMLATLGGM